MLLLVKIGQMTRLQSIKRFLVEQDAATTVEYAAILMLILLAVISAVQFFGDVTHDNFRDSSGKLDGALGN